MVEEEGEFAPFAPIDPNRFDFTPCFDAIDTSRQSYKTIENNFIQFNDKRTRITKFISVKEIITEIEENNNASSLGK